MDQLLIPTASSYRHLTYSRTQKYDISNAAVQVSCPISHAQAASGLLHQCMQRGWGCSLAAQRLREAHHLGRVRTPQVHVSLPAGEGCWPGTCTIHGATSADGGAALAADHCRGQNCAVHRRMAMCGPS